jgi:hypothetical protein
VLVGEGGEGEEFLLAIGSGGFPGVGAGFFGGEKIVAVDGFAGGVNSK